MRFGLIAKKIGMTQIFEDNGTCVPVTALQIFPCRVVEIKDVATNGYDAIKVATKQVDQKKLNKPEDGYFKKLGIEERYSILKEFRLEDCSKYNIGDQLDVALLEPGQLIDVTGVSKGKGFAGAMKRHGFGGLRATHGVSISHRSHGSTGNRTLPGRVFKNKKMAGHMGCDRVTTLNLKVHSIDAESGVAFIKGAVAGAKGGIVYIRNAVKQ